MEVDAKYFRLLLKIAPIGDFKIIEIWIYIFLDRQIERAKLYNFQL